MLKYKYSILILAQYFPPDMGGAATRAYNAAKGLKLIGCKITVVAAFPHYPNGNIPKKYRWKPLVFETHEGIHIIRTIVPPLESKGILRRLILFISFIISSLFPLLTLRKADVILAMNPNIIVFFPAYIYSKIKKIPLILNADDLWPEELVNTGLLKENSIIIRIAEKIAQIAYRKADLITPISPGYVRIISLKYGVRPSKIKVIRGGVDISKFKKITKKKREKFTVLYIGAFSIAYDFDQVLLAAKKLEKYSDIEFILQGGGELKKYIKKKARELNLKNVRIIDKVVSRQQVAEILSNADVLLLPLRDFGKPYLGISSKLYEYQAAGKPIICCAIGQPAKYITMTKSGIVVKPGDYNAISRAILYLKNNEKEASKMGINGRNYVYKHVSIEAIGKKFYNCICSLLSK